MNTWKFILILLIPISCRAEFLSILGSSRAWEDLLVYDGSGSVAGVKVALDKINNDTTILPGYTLHYTFTDSKVRICD